MLLTACFTHSRPIVDNLRDFRTESLEAVTHIPMLPFLRPLLIAEIWLSTDEKTLERGSKSLVMSIGLVRRHLIYRCPIAAQ
jgi:hypothetical protein